MSVFRQAAAVVAAGLVLGAAVPTVSGAADSFKDVIVRNDDSNPVPVRPTPPPLWQGTPYHDVAIVFNAGVVQCEAMNPIPAGTVLFLERVISNFNVPPGASGFAQVSVSPLGAPTASLFIPTFPTAPALQVAGLYDQYAGSLEVGLPVTAVEACVAGGNDEAPARARIEVIGFLMPAV
jgi:hypothetical protein